MGRRGRGGEEEGERGRGRGGMVFKNIKGEKKLNVWGGDIGQLFYRDHF